jgi:hypothetical protein
MLCQLGSMGFGEDLFSGTPEASLARLLCCTIWLLSEDGCAVRRGAGLDSVRRWYHPTTPSWRFRQFLTWPGTFHPRCTGQGHMYDPRTVMGFLHVLWGPKNWKGGSCKVAQLVHLQVLLRTATLNFIKQNTWKICLVLFLYVFSFVCELLGALNGCALV